MKLIFYSLSSLLFWLIILVWLTASSCGGSKRVTERRNYMMPKKDELPKNKKYKMVDKRKVYKVSGTKVKKSKKNYSR